MKDTMTSIRKTASILILSLTAAVAGQAMAAEPAGLTRAQVLADLAQAQRSGNIIDNFTGLPLNQLNPQSFPAQAQAQGKTRAQVLAELEQARAQGQLAQYFETDYPLNAAQGQPGIPGKEADELR
ncbi:MAG: DUF4148 domain-containing protein, partial [Comamonas sp.]